MIVSSNLGFSSSTGRFNWSGGILNITGTATFSNALLIPIGGILKLDGDDYTPFSDPITVSGGGTFSLDPGVSKNQVLARQLASLIIGPNNSLSYGRVNLLPAANQSLRQLLIVTSLNVAGSINAWQGIVDLSNNDFEVQNGSVSILTIQLKAGFNGGARNGSTGILSSSAGADTTHFTALAIIQNNQSGNAVFTSRNPFDSTVPAANSVLIKYTYYSDTNLDGKVDGSDYSRIDSGYLSNGTQTGWFNGDFNYDGVISGSDYTLIDNAFNSQAAQLTASIASLSASGTTEAAGVPEPAFVGMLAIAGLVGRRRDRINRPHVGDGPKSATTVTGKLNIHRSI